MAKCSVCGKTSLVPERFGSSLMCKICFMKINGPFWKYLQFDRREDVEKQRKKTIESAKALNFPEEVVLELNRYFDDRVGSMNVCDCCGESVQNITAVGSAVLCKKCYSKIDKKELKEDRYPDNKTVEENREKILKLAAKQQLPQKVIDGINEHFDSKIQAGLVGTVYGVCQELKVFEDHAVLNTYPNFDEEEMSKYYAKMLRKNGNGGGLVSNNVAQVLVKDSLGGGLVKAGMNLAKSVALGAAVDAVFPQQKVFRVNEGDVVLSYNHYDILDFQKPVSVGYDDEMGYIRFRKSISPSDVENAPVFFFRGGGEAKEMYNYICQRIDFAKGYAINLQANPTIPKQVTHESVADEILKFKNLLDMGAITEDEFQEKKNELLHKN